MEHKHLSFFRTNDSFRTREEGKVLDWRRLTNLTLNHYRPRLSKVKPWAKSDETAQLPAHDRVSMSSGIMEWLLPGYSTNFAPRNSPCHIPRYFHVSAWIASAIHHQCGRFYRRQNAATHRYSAMPKQTRKHDFGGNPWTGKPKREPSRLEDTSAKQRKQHAHKAPVRRAASKFRG